MSIFSWIFGKKAKADSSEQSKSTELILLDSFEIQLKELLLSDRYLARRNYWPICLSYQDLHNQFYTLQKSKTLGYFCTNNGIELQRIEKFLTNYVDLISKKGSKLVSEHNDAFVSKHLQQEKDYLDGILKKVDPAICLEPFLGCTNYKPDKSGCDNFMTKEYYIRNILSRKK